MRRPRCGRRLAVDLVQATQNVIGTETIHGRFDGRAGDRLHAECRLEEDLPTPDTCPLPA